jgi:hypothetical protein
VGNAPKHLMRSRRHGVDESLAGDRGPKTSREVVGCVGRKRAIAPGGLFPECEGEWFFARTLEGRAVQDVGSRSRDESHTAIPHANRYGSSVRTFDPHTRTWQVTWFNPVTGAFNVLHTHGGRAYRQRAPGRRRESLDLSEITDQNLGPARPTAGWQLAARSRVLRPQALSGNCMRQDGVSAE